MNYDIEQKLKEVIIAVSDDISIEMINEDVNLVEDFSFDSVNIIQLVVEIENAFDIEVDDDNLIFENLATYKGLHKMICEKLEEKMHAC